jgi:hypothetical protein
MPNGFLGQRIKMIKSLWCPKCKKKGLNLYNKKGERPQLTDDITHLWCLYCDYKIDSNTQESTKPSNKGGIIIVKRKAHIDKA